MKKGSIEIFIQNSKEYQLVNTNLKDFIIFSLRKPMNSGSIQIIPHEYETYLIVKSFQKAQTQQHIGFMKIKQGQKVSQNKNSAQIFMKSQSYYSTFLRHINLSYCKKLSQLLQNLNIKPTLSLFNEWIILYQVHNFILNPKESLNIKVQSPIYGKQVLISSYCFQNINQQNLSQISNFFRKDGQNFYFVSQPFYKKSIKNFDLIYSIQREELYGLVLQINDVFLCLPFHNILFESCCQLRISQQIFPNLYKTCYVQYFGSYCSGIQIFEDHIISTRHLLPILDQKIGTKVYIRKFPFNKLKEGIVSKIGSQNLDIIQIQIILEKNFDKENKEKKLQKHDLTFQKNSSTKNVFTSEFQKYFSLITQKQNIPLNNLDQFNNFKLGSPVTILGFGKYAFHSSIFNKLQFIFPTISRGIISKLIKIKDQLVFIKTDAKLYNGFSGSGIWGKQLKGMAVFILKNKNNLSHYNRHNFSYSINFIKRMLSSQRSILNYQNNTQLQEFDKIQTRKNFKIKGLPKPKL